ncbi:RcpC/CpaB family pilus assembly protein [Paenibacillus polymyxa]|uniref:RcpC/CpaB family pilus assembly protein n=1 Tax=Paenibacillus polymyxa TaxID=1406 RepID=UPI0032AF3068
MLGRFWNRNTRALLIVILSILLGIFAFWTNNKAVTQRVQTEKIWVAASDILPNSPITEANVVQKAMIVKEIPTDAVKDKDSLDWKDSFSSQYGFKAGDPLRSSYITSAEKSKMGTPVGLKDGRVEVGVKTDLAASAGNEVRPGTIVQVKAFISNGVEGRGLTKADSDLEKILVKKVVNSEGLPPDGTAERGSIIPAVVTLEVTPEQGARLMSYQETGKVYLLPAGIKK